MPSSRPNLKWRRSDMRPFAFSRADTVQAAVNEHLITDTQAGRASVHAPNQFIAGGTTLLDLMKLDVMRPQNITDINALEHTPSGEINFGPRGLHLGALGPYVSGGRSSRGAKKLSGDRAIACARGQPANTQHGLTRRQCSPAHPLHLFPRYIIRRLQQTQSRLGLRSVAGHQSVACRTRHQQRLHRNLSRRLCPGTHRARCRS